jgi:hypothetical protein
LGGDEGRERYLARLKRNGIWNTRDDEMNVRELLGRATSTKYTRAMEAEVVRLRAENRALLNSILGIAGVPPVVVAENDASPAAGLKVSAEKANTGRLAAPPKSSAPRNNLVSSTSQKTVPPMRRRSWHQIYRMLEINSARKKEANEII